MSSRPRKALLLGLACLGCLAAACEVGPRSGLGLRLPPGDVERGRAAFRELACVRCHSIAEEPDPLPGESREIHVVLGGRVPHIRTHGELVTSIVNPSHGFAEGHDLDDEGIELRSLMPEFNDLMTVEQLIDLTAYLQSKYTLDMDALFGP